ncbi:nuclease domain-containing protein [Paenirhodobacter enshiensis]|uniref:nuclease domain-containing protein n=1 Tax=Paenirhodobacter enshiensis TaxID=1105367 RepID=UPI0035AD917C
MIFQPNFKTPPAVSKRVRDSAQGQSCTLRLPCCNGDDSTVVLAHLRFFGWAGISQKPPDFLAVYACSACHDALDRRNNAGEPLWEFEDVLRALGETQIRLFRAGLLTIK